MTAFYSLRSVFYKFFTFSTFVCLAFSGYIYHQADLLLIDVDLITKHALAASDTWLVAVLNEHVTSMQDIASNIVMAIVVSVVILGIAFVVFVGMYHTNIHAIINKEKRANFLSMLASRVFDSSKEALMLVDVNDNIIMVNKAYEKITGYDGSNAVGKNIKTVDSFQRVHDIGDIWDCYKANKSWQGEVINFDKKGHAYSKYLTIEPIYIDDNHDPMASPVNNHAIKFFDIHDRRKVEAETLYFLRYDELTGLPNRKFLSQLLEHTIIESTEINSSFALLFMDVDRFKSINDLHGHHVGDSVLQQIAARLRTAIRNTDFVSRFGGDDFIVVLKNIDLDCLSVVVDGIMKYLTDGNYTVKGEGNNEDYTFDITMCVGVSCFPSMGITEDDLITHADTARFYAKRLGRNQVIYYDPSLDITTNDVELSLIRNVKSENSDRFFLMYQPLVDIENMCVVGCEALLRWRNNDGNLVSPVVFIPLLEQNNLISEVGLWVLETACSDFNRSYYPSINSTVPNKLDPSKINIAVNISIKQLEKSDFVDAVMGVLKRTGLSPNRLELEVTESIMLTDSDDVVDKLKRLLALGINISLDDFGSGYSNLSRLVSLPLTKIKMDGMFMRHGEDNINSKKVISSVIRIGKDLNLTTLAEGVETADHLEYLKQQGCNEVQGYYFSKPLLLTDLLNYSVS